MPRARQGRRGYERGGAVYRASLGSDPGTRRQRGDQRPRLVLLDFPFPRFWNLRKWACLRGWPEEEA